MKKRLDDQNGRHSTFNVQALCMKKVLSPIMLSHGSKFDIACTRQAFAYWIIMHEHPFTIAEEDEFVHLLKGVNPRYKKYPFTIAEEDEFVHLLKVVNP